MSRICSCGGILTSAELVAGQRLACISCGRWEVLQFGGQVLDPQDRHEPSDSCAHAERRRGSSPGAQQPGGFCVCGADCHDSNSDPCPGCHREKGCRILSPGGVALGSDHENQQADRFPRLAHETGAGQLNAPVMRALDHELVGRENPVPIGSLGAQLSLIES